VALYHGTIPDFPPIHALWTGSRHIVPKARPNGRPKTEAIKLCKFLRKSENTKLCYILMLVSAVSLFFSLVDADTDRWLQWLK